MMLDFYTRVWAVLRSAGLVNERFEEYDMKLNKLQIQNIWAE